jgi:hypothetical protein
MRSRLTTGAIALVMAMFMVVAVGCSDDDDNPAAPDMGNGAMVRVIHASPDAPAVDIYAEGVAAPLITDLAYGETSAYLDLDPGTYNVQIRAAGANPSSAPVYETGDLVLDEGDKITALAAGLLAGAPASPEAFSVIPLLEDFTAAGAGNAIVRVVHAGADAPTVAVDVGADGTPEITDFERYEDTGEAGVPLPAGEALQIAIWAGNPLSRVTVFTTPELPEGAELFVIATGLLGKLPRQVDGFALLAVGPSGTVGFIRQNPVVFALHGSPDAPAVDIFAGAAELADNLSFGDLSDPIQVPPAAYDLDFRVHDNGPVAATVTTPILVAGERYLAVATGFVGEGEFTVLPLGDAFALGSTNPLLRVVHASPDAPAVDVGVVDGDFTAVPGLTNLAYTQASAGPGVNVPAASLTLGLAPTGTTTPAVTFDVTPTAGLRAFAVAAGSLLGTGETFRLILVNTSVFPWVTAEVLPN